MELDDKTKDAVNSFLAATGSIPEGANRKEAEELDDKTKDAVNSFLAATGSIPEGANGKEAEEVKEPRPRLHCEVCDIYCVGDQAYESHLKGQKHTKVVKTKALLGNKVVLSNNPSECVLTSNLAHCDEPIIGLQNVTEFQPPNEVCNPATVWYFCNMCKCRLDLTTVMTHLVGIKHRLAYMRKNYPDMVPQIMGERNRAEQTKVATEKSRMIVNREGKKLPNVQIDKENIMGDVVEEQLKKEKRKVQTMRLDKIMKETRPCKRKSKFEQELYTLSGPIIGLQHIFEIQPSDEMADMGVLRWYCDLCDVTCDMSTIRTHIVGSKHRKGYITKHDYPDMLREISKPPTEVDRQQMKTTLEGFCSTIEKEGRQPIKVRITFTDLSLREPGNRKRPADGPLSGGIGSKFAASERGRGRGARGAPATRKPIASPRGRGMSSGRVMSSGRGLSAGRGRGLSTGRGFSGGRGFSSGSRSSLSPSAAAPVRSARPVGLAVSMDRLLNLLDATPINTEEEAELALELSNHLTQELLEYRQRSVPDYMFERAKMSSGLDDSSLGPKRGRGRRGRGARGGSFMSRDYSSESYNNTYNDYPSTSGGYGDFSQDTATNPSYDAPAYDAPAYDAPANPSYDSYGGQQEYDDRYGGPPQQSYDNYSYQRKENTYFSGVSNYPDSQLPDAAGSGMW